MYDGPERRSENARVSQIEKDIARITSLIESDFKHRKEFRDRIEALLLKHTEVIYGNESRSGLVTRVVELETAYKNHQGNIRVVWVAVAGLVVNQLWKIFSLSFVK
jgi:hypothetical protein